MVYIDAQHYFQSIVAHSDPSTGSAIAEDSCFRRPEFVRAAQCALSALDAAVKRAERVVSRPANLGKPWSADEDAQLTCAFSERMSVADIATLHARSTGSIESRLQKLGIITAEQRTTRDRY